MFPQIEIDEFRRYWQRRKPGTSTALHYSSDVSIFFHWAGERSPGDITVHDIDRFIDYQHDLGWQPNTTRRRVIALRMFYDHLAYQGDRDIPNPVQPRRHYIAVGHPLPRDLNDDLIERLFAAIGDHLRDRAIFTVMLHAGARVGELVTLRLADLFLVGSAVPHLRLSGKGGRERLVYLSVTAAQALQDYLAARRVTGPASVFLNHHGQPITVTGIQLQLAKYCHQAGVWVTCHQLRHTFASRLVGADVPITSVQKLLGHASLRTTQRYIQIADTQVERDYRAGVQHLESLAARRPGEVRP